MLMLLLGVWEKAGEWNPLLLGHEALWLGRCHLKESASRRDLSFSLLLPCSSLRDFLADPQKLLDGQGEMQFVAPKAQHQKTGQGALGGLVRLSIPVLVLAQVMVSGL